MQTNARHIIRGSSSCLFTASRRARPAQCRYHRSAVRAAGTSTEQKSDPRLKDRVIIDDFAQLRASYSAPKNPLILAHGLFGFDQLHLGGPHLPALHYWRGITEALSANGVEVITASVPPAATIEKRAQKLAEVIELKAKGKSVNIIAMVCHNENSKLMSKGGLDARFMISQLKPPGVRVLSLTTIATPHRGSTFADYVFSRLGSYTPRINALFARLSLDSGAFDQLTTRYMADKFNPITIDSPLTSYYSYGATFRPPWYSAFRQSGKIVSKMEGENDGLVSVESSKWGSYRGTLQGVSHLDLINWTNRLKWLWWQIWGGKRDFNAIAFYLDIADMLAKEGL